MRRIVIFAGRFQPFGPHHLKVYHDLVERFPDAEILITTSNNTEEGISPLNFEQKKKIITRNGIPETQIRQVSNPYRPIELGLDPDNTTVVYVVGSKDKDRFPVYKKNGELSYIQPYSPLEHLQPIINRSYVYYTPTQQVSGEPMSSTKIRRILRTCSEYTFEKIFGWYDADVHSWFKPNNRMDAFQKPDSLKKGISYIYDDVDLTFKDVIKIIDGFKFPGKDVWEKTDGQNISFTCRNGKVFAARNKAQFINPLGKADAVRYWKDKNPNFAQSISDAFDIFQNEVSKSPDYWQKIFNHPQDNVFINCEILDNRNKNVIDYGDGVKVIVHQAVKYDDSGYEVERFTINFGQTDKFKSDNIYKILLEDTVVRNYTNAIKSCAESHNLTLDSTIRDFYATCLSTYVREEFPFLADLKNQTNVDIIVDKLLGNSRSELKKLYTDFPMIKRRIDSLDNLALKYIYLEYCFVLENLLDHFATEVINKVDCENRNEQEILSNYKNVLVKPNKTDSEKYWINRLNDFQVKIAPIEGVIFTYNNKMYKLTGLFKYINQIFSKERYK